MLFVPNRVSCAYARFDAVDDGDPSPFQSAAAASAGSVGQPEPASEAAADWFEFAWSVTRAIRKDITQQQLSDLSAVCLVEKCARFHIMCGERLVEEDAHAFSRKLNDENLTKCLQTLKHLYEDLRNEGAACANEPEFRAYEVKGWKGEFCYFFFA